MAKLTDPQAPEYFKIHAWIMREFDGGRQTRIEWEELEPVVMHHLDRMRAPAHPGTA